MNGVAGGQVRNQGEGVVLTFPAGAFSGLGTISIVPGLGSLGTLSAAAPTSRAGLEPQGFLLTPAAFELTAKVNGQTLTVFNRPVNLAVRYSASHVRMAGGSAANLRLMQYQGAARGWEDLKAQMDPQTGTFRTTVTGPGLFALLVDLPEPRVTAPVAKALVSDMAPLLKWASPTGTTQYHLQVVPANNDGPGINLVGTERGQSQFQVAAPRLGQGNYVLLPGMSYVWRVRTSAAASPLGEQDPRWSEWAMGSFSTVAPDSTLIVAVSPTHPGGVRSTTPLLEWSDADPKVFYFEVQLSHDPEFITDPAQATSAVFWELVHGGLTKPLNSYQVRREFPLEPGWTYYWRVRPRVQGDGAPVGWGPTFSFRTE